jgi:hypothetical protein
MLRPEPDHHQLEGMPPLVMAEAKDISRRFLCPVFIGILRGTERGPGRRAFERMLRRPFQCGLRLTHASATPVQLIAPAVGWSGEARTAGNRQSDDYSRHEKRGTASPSTTVAASGKKPLRPPASPRSITCSRWCATRGPTRARRDGESRSALRASQARLGESRRSG